MNSREYDRIADLLSQIYSKYRKLNTLGKHCEQIAEPMREELLEIIERALTLNDFMGKLTEKGLI